MRAHLLTVTAHYSYAKVALKSPIHHQTTVFPWFMPSNRHSGAVGNSMPQFPLHALGLKLEGHADLVSALVEVLTVDDRRQGEGDT